MSADQPADQRPFPSRWIHAFEEDTGEGAVYRPEDADVPLSRRPRERLVLDAAGTATLLTAGPDDRLVARPATWRDGSTPEGKGDADIEIVSRSPEKLVVKIR